MTAPSNCVKNRPDGGKRSPKERDKGRKMKNDRNKSNQTLNISCQWLHCQDGSSSLRKVAFLCRSWSWLMDKSHYRLINPHQHFQRTTFSWAHFYGNLPNTLVKSSNSSFCPQFRLSGSRVRPPHSRKAQLLLPLPPHLVVIRYRPEGTKPLPD